MQVHNTIDMYTKNFWRGIKIFHRPCPKSSIEHFYKTLCEGFYKWFSGNVYKVTQYLNEATGALYGIEKPYCYVPINVIPHPLGRVGQYRGFGKVHCQII